jgi:ribose transport system substrate-binding protein
MFRSLLKIVVLALMGLLLFSMVTAQDTSWTDFTDDMVSGTVITGARESGPLPENCPVPEPKDHYVIGFAQANSAEPWRTAMNQQLQAAVDALNAEMMETGGPTFELVIADAAQDNAKQVADIENFLTQGVDLLITSPNEAAPLTDAVNNAWASCVPVILLDRDITNTDYTMFIGANNVSIGREAGRYVAQWCADQGLDPCNVFEIDGLSGTSGAIDRATGFAEGIEGSTATVTVLQNANWLRERAVEVANSTLQANPDINVIYAENDPMAEGAYIAAQNLGLDLSQILFVGVDALPTPDGGIVSVMQGRLGATFVYPTGGQQAIDWAKAILVDRVNPPQRVELPFEGVFPDNAQDVCNTYQCPLAEGAEATAEATTEAGS